MKMIMRVRCLIAAIAFALTTIGATALAQTPPSSVEQVRQLNLPSLPGDFTVYYSQGFEKRAQLMRSLLAEATAYYRSALGLTPSFAVALLNEADWQKVNPQVPYGVLFTSAAPHVIFAPASPENAVERADAQLLANASPMVRDVMQEYRIPFIGLHELGHTYIEASRIHTGNKWFSEFLASYYAFNFLAERHPKLAAAWDSANRVATAGPPPNYRALADFERLYNRVGVENYAWYQAQFLQRVSAVNSQRGVEFIRSVNSSFPKLAEGEDWLESLLQRPATIEATLERLEKLAPGFVAWANTMK